MYFFFIIFHFGCSKLSNRIGNIEKISWGLRLQTPVPVEGGYGRGLTIKPVEAATAANPAHGLPTAWSLEAATAADLS